MSLGTPPRSVLVDDSDPRIQYYGLNWFQDNGSRDNLGNWGPSYRSTLHGTRSNASLSFPFNVNTNTRMTQPGSRVIVTGSNNPRNDSGVLDPTWECFVDNISIGGSIPYQFTANNWVFCDSGEDNLVDSAHVITVNATVIKNQTFWLDRIQYVPTATTPLDNEDILVDNLDPSLHFSEGWGYDFGTNLATNSNSYVVTSFVGVSLSLYGFIPAEYPHGPATGTYSIDGGDTITFPLKGLPVGSNTTLENQKLFETSTFPAGQHTILVTFLGTQETTPLVVDYLIIQNRTISSTSTTTSQSTFPSGTAPSRSRSTTITPSSSDIPKPVTSPNHSSNNVGPIIGGIVGALVLLTIAAIPVFYYHRWPKKRTLGYMNKNATLDLTVGSIYNGPSLPTEGVAPSPQHRPQTTQSASNTRRNHVLRGIVHYKDSGVRLPRDDDSLRATDVVMELPPAYTIA